jgi:hypothetical protein
MFNYLHCFLFLSETDNKFKSQNLEAKLSIDTFSKLLSHSCQIGLKQLSFKYAILILELACGLKKKSFKSFFIHINSENKQ